MVMKLKKYSARKNKKYGSCYFSDEEIEANDRRAAATKAAWKLKLDAMERLFGAPLPNAGSNEELMEWMKIQLMK